MCRLLAVVVLGETGDERVYVAGVRGGAQALHDHVESLRPPCSSG
jgi:hypothetical protein